MSASRPSASLPILLFWSRFTLRHARQEWVQTVLLLFILSLGVGTFISIRLANRAAVEGFQLFTQSLRGPSDWNVETAGGSIPLNRLPDIRRALDPLPAQLFPVIERSLVPTGFDLDVAASQRIHLIGIDLVQARSAITGGESVSNDDFWTLLDDPQHLLISTATAERWGVAKGDSLDLILEGRPERFTVGGFLPEFRDKTPVPEDLAIADIAAVIRRLNLDSVDRVEVVLPQGPLRQELIAEAGQRLRQLDPAYFRVGSPTDQQVDGASMTAAFRMNLTVLSLVALLVGLYLIAQTLDATVSRRRAEIATLRSIGISPREIHRLWLSEALLYGLLAGLLGLVAGSFMAEFTVEAVTTTVRSLYRDTVGSAVHLEPVDVLLSFGLGIIGSLVAAWLPARDASSTPPAQFLRLGKRIPPFALFQHPWIGLTAILIGVGLLFAPPWIPQPGTRIPVAGYATSLLWLVGGTLVAVGTINPIGKLIHTLGHGSAPLRLAGSRLADPTSRHQLALSGFFVAIGMAVAMSFLINSFEHTVTDWLKQRLRADLFISTIGFSGSDTDQRMPDAFLDELAALPEVRELDRFRSVETQVHGVRTSVGGMRFDLLGKDQELLWIKGPLAPGDVPPDCEAIGYANENLQRRAGLSLGEIVEVETPAGTRKVWIAGFHADYARDNGLLFVDLPVIDAWYPGNGYETAAVFLHDGVDIETFQSQIKSKFPGLAIRQNGELMKTVLLIFNQTFAVTYALQVIGLVVALGGLSLGLLSLLRESGRELSLQRTLGMNRREIALSTAMEGTGIAVAGLLSGLLLGVALGLVLMYVINRQSFGWTLQAAFPVRDALSLATAVMILSFGVSYLTGWLHLRKWKQEAL